ncbi:MAG TPA: hypothetical protein PKW80_11860 [Bacteroidales bacterium]|nr:hypothetical protein [Bacteroidales bacterium]
MKKSNYILKGFFIVFILLCSGLYGQNKNENLVSDTLSGAQNHNTRPGENSSGIYDDAKYLSEKTVSEIISILDSSRNKNELKKLAKELGDRELRGEVMLTAADKKIIDEKVTRYIYMSGIKNPNTYEEANGQIQRLWHLSVPVLLDSLESNNLSVAEFCAKSLILMRDKEIIKTIIQKAKSAQDMQKKEILAFTLSKMTEQRKPVIPDRSCMSKEESAKLFKRMVKPALKKLRKN